MQWQRFLFIIICSFLVSCHSDLPPADVANSEVAKGVMGGGFAGAAIGSLVSNVNVPIAAVIGGITGGAIASYLVEQQTPGERLVSLLRSDHIGVITVGQDYMLVLPSSVFFFPNSTHFNEKMYIAIQDMILFMHQFDIETVKVAGYTDNAGDPIRNMALSRQQAQIISKLLWDYGLNSALVYSIGYGGDYPIATNSTPEGRGANRRIQITFRRLTTSS